MSFEYGLYTRGCLYVPLAIALLALVILGSFSRLFIKRVVQKNVSGYDVCKILIAVSITVFTIVLNLCRLFNGGFALIYERENDAVKIEGTITEISEMGKYEFPELTTEYEKTALNGHEIKINDVKCMCPDIGDFDVGDSVVVVYLPESSYIISIELK